MHRSEFLSTSNRNQHWWTQPEKEDEAAPASPRGGKPGSAWIIWEQRQAGSCRPGSTRACDASNKQKRLSSPDESSVPAVEVAVAAGATCVTPHSHPHLTCFTPLRYSPGHCRQLTLMVKSTLKVGFSPPRFSHTTSLPQMFSSPFSLANSPFILGLTSPRDSWNPLVWAP